MPNPDATIRNPLLVLLTGVSGCGKTAIAKHLQGVGHNAISLDGHPGLCSWTDLDGRPASKPASPGLEWLRAHEWSWNPGVLDTLITELRGIDAPAVWLAGVAGNTPDLAGRFDVRILLRIDRNTMLQRIVSPTRANTFGREGDSAQFLGERFDTDQKALAAICDLEADATGPLDDVATSLMYAAGQAARQHNRTR